MRAIASDTNVPIHPPANDLTGPRFAGPAEGPYRALTFSPTPSGAIPLEDVEGEIIGWATDVAGHTSETVAPEGRSPAEIATTARLLAEAWTLRSIAAALAAIEPTITARFMVLGTSPDETLSLAAKRAREALARIYGGGA